jgi:hypothetical protein
LGGFAPLFLWLAACGGSASQADIGVTGSGGGGGGTIPDAASGADAGAAPDASAAPDVSSAADANVTLAEACTIRNTSYCNMLARCLAQTFRVFTDMADCVQRIVLGCTIEHAADPPGLNPSWLVACAHAREAGGCDSLLMDPPACVPPPGNLPTGATCRTDSQCQGRYCDRANSGPCGTCAERGAAGAECHLWNYCEPGLICGNSRCVTPVNIGEACPNGFGCLPVTQACVDGRCAVAPREGEHCSSSCDSSKPLSCVGGICAVNPVASGELCNMPGDCPPGNVCVPEPPVRRCTPLREDGQPCGTGYSFCRHPATCVDGVCTLPTSSCPSGDS